MIETVTHVVGRCAAGVRTVTCRLASWSERQMNTSCGPVMHVLRLRYGGLEAGEEVVAGGEALERQPVPPATPHCSMQRDSRAEIADRIADDIGGVDAGRAVMRDPARATADRPLTLTSWAVRQLQ